MLSILRQANEQRQKEWDPTDAITIEYRGNELAGEAGEACNIIKKLARQRLGIRGSRATAAQLAEELADVVICADLIAMHTGIDLAAAIRDKFNLTSAKQGLHTMIAGDGTRLCTHPEAHTEGYRYCDYCRPAAGETSPETKE